jgi:hypothetical protein
VVLKQSENRQIMTEEKMEFYHIHMHLMYLTQMTWMSTINGSNDPHDVLNYTFSEIESLENWGSVSFATQ